jgi:hypothetical protein
MSFDDAWGNSRSGGGRNPPMQSRGGLDSDVNYRNSMSSIGLMTTNVAQIKAMTEKLGTNKDSVEMRERL